MKLLLDTHALIWWLGSRQLIPQTVKDVLIDGANDVYVSAATAWEIATKQRIGKLRFDTAFLANFDASVAALGFAPLPVNAMQMIAGAQIVSAHKDPFDRMLAGQALVDQMAVVTTDRAFTTLGVQVLW